MGVSLREKVNSQLDQWGYALTDIAGRFFAEVGAVSQFGWYSMRLFFTRPLRIRELIHQIEFIGYQSIFIIILTGALSLIHI